ncbi:hypothetical protein [Haloferula sp. BvORR071]|uniref:hypothetical protein n=1 Tax=Haloferula sp. BvORR071 TaxID=1396141 RepID=UPI0009E00811|nr:hypothetical protein [Haloferula sp. BvORR071]
MAQANTLEASWTFLFLIRCLHQLSQQRRYRRGPHVVGRLLEVQPAEVVEAIAALAVHSEQSLAEVEAPHGLAIIERGDAGHLANLIGTRS